MASASMQHVFGPVPTRRLGMSLGIDPVLSKTCNFNCVYCQLGRSRHLARRRKAFFSVADIVAEVAAVLARVGTDEIDWVTFVGSGETTLYSRLGWAIRYVKSLSGLPVAVITNGSLLHLPQVRADISAADAVLPSLDAGTPELFRRINRPRRDVTLQRHVEGLVEFRKMFQGKLWVEVMLLGGINDTAEALTAIASMLRTVEPDEIHLATPTRPPAEPWVEPPGPDGLERAASILGSVAKVIEPVTVDAGPVLDGDLADSVLKIISRHPLQEAEVRRLLDGWFRERAEEILVSLAENEEIQIVERLGRRFWCAADLVYPDGVQEHALPRVS